MKSISKLLPALALVLGATLAMATNLPSMVVEKSATKVWTPDDNEPSGYRDITNEVPGTHYNCVGEDEHCRVEFTDDDPVNGTMTVLQEGIYTP